MSASFTLDKVTVSRIPYTVLLTYFFDEGRIQCILNSIHLMTSSDYDGEGSAAMVGNDLMKSLGLTREEVAKVFVHAAYDGVYSLTSERVRGGGSLNLVNHFAEWCGLEEGDITGHWDVGHQLQIIYFLRVSFKCR